MLLSALRATLVPNILLVLLIVCPFLLSDAAPLVREDEEEDSCPRLPQYITPQSIGVYITPELEGDTFQGQALYVLQSDSFDSSGDSITIVMHAQELLIDSCQLLVMGSNSEESLHDTIRRLRNEETIEYIPCNMESVNEDTHQITVNLEPELTDWRSYRLYFEYTGTIRSDMTGFYETVYYAGDERRRVLSTQFQPTHARKVFPCFDEPLFKSNYSIEISIPNTRPEYFALSNMPLSFIEESDDDDSRWYVFHTTPPMSSYLVAWVVSDFGYEEDEHNDQSEVAIRTYARRDALPTTKHSLDVTRSLLKFLEDYTAVPYLYEFHAPQTLNKIDQVAIPDFSAGAMENWGLITYRETALLYNNGPESARRRISIVIAHELVHMWFGNLVTTARWDTTWLNEGFAEYLEYLATDSVHGDWRMREQFVVEDLHSALVDDGLSTSPPLTRAVCSSADALAAFHSLTYTKGASVLRMFSYIIGEENFRKALESYLNNNAFKAVEPEDLFRELKTYNQEAGLSESDLDKLLHSWTEQSGYPVVFATRNYEEGTVIVTQKKFEMQPHDDDYPPYFVPLTWTQRGHGFEARQPQSYLTIDEPTKTIEGMPVNDTWIIFNIQQTGFYRVMYDLTNWELLINYLNNEANPVDGIHLLNRAQLIDDMFAFGRSGTINYETILRFMDYLRRETDYIPWVPAFSGFSYMNRMLVKNDKYPLFKQYLLDIILKLYQRFEFTSQETHVDNLLLNRVSSLACTLDHSHCVTAAETYLQNFLANVDTIPADLRSIVYCHGIRNKEEADWEELWKIYIDSDDEADKTLIMSGLGCSTNKDILERLLTYSITSEHIRQQDAASVFSAVYSNPHCIQIDTEPCIQGVDVALEFLSNNFEEIERYYGAMGAIQNIVTGIAARISTTNQHTQMTSFLDAYRDELGSTADAAKEIMTPNLLWASDLAPEIFEELEERSLYRLPTSVLPEQYNLNLRIESNDLATLETFEGDISILVEAKEATQSIFLHTEKLIISESISVTHVVDSSRLMLENNAISDSRHVRKFGSSRDDTIFETIEELPDNHLIKLILKEPLIPGEKYLIEMQYSGPLRSDMVGFYKTYYRDETMEKVYLLGTKFAPVHARKAFPCFDEPSFKARFKITITIPSTLDGYDCISNAEKKESTPLREGSKVVEFDYTPIMSTYIVAWLISDLQPSTIVDETREITFTTWARPDAVSTAQYSLSVTPVMLQKLEDYTGYPYHDKDDDYPLKKLDQVGTPDFVSGAMENWGLITYRETALLYAEGAPAAAKKRAATVIAHELAHMWFGNIVTCAWWEATWLNEGFAQYFQYFVTQQVEASWNIMDQHVVDQLQSALALDAERTSKPLTHRVVTPSNAIDSFGSLTYSKGSSFLRMLSFVIGEENLEAAIKAYVKARKYQAATPDDLFEQLLPYAGNADLTGAELLEFLRSWTEQPGFPVLYVTRHYDDPGTVTLKQERFLATNDDVTPQLYYIPLSWLQTGGIFDKPKLEGFLSNQERSKQLTGISENGWLIFNTQHIGYFRVHYDDENWRRISESLLERYGLIHWLNRAQLLDDAFTFARYGRMTYEQLFALTDYLPVEDEYPPWAAALAGFAVLDRLLVEHSEYHHFQDYVLSLLSEPYVKYGFSESRTSQSDQLIVAAITARVCAMGHDECRQKAAQQLQEELNGGARIHADVRGAVYCHGIRNSPDEYWDALWERFSTEPDEAERALQLTGLGCSTSAEKLRQLLESTIKGEGVRKQEATSAFAAVYASKLGTDVTLEFLHDEYVETKEYLGSVGNVISGVANRIVTPEQRASLVELVQHRWWEGLSDTGPAALTTVDRNFAWNEENAQTVITILEEKNQEITTPEPGESGESTTTTVSGPDTTTTDSVTVPETTTEPVTVPETTTDPVTVPETTTDSGSVWNEINFLLLLVSAGLLLQFQ